MAEDKKQQYSAGQIQVLEGLDPVRKRPGMYIGGTGLDGLHHLIKEVVDNGIDEAMAGYADTVDVLFRADNWIEVSDNGRGIPVDKHAKTGKSALETVLTVLHAGGKFGAGGYKVSGGLHGVGVSVVNALSTNLVATVRRDGKIYQQTYKLGKPVNELAVIGEYSDTERSGTIIAFLADANIFETIHYEYAREVERLRQQAYLTKGVRLRIRRQKYSDNQELYYADSKTYYFDGGIKSYVEHLNSNREAINQPAFYIEKTIDQVQVELALQYSDSYTENVLSFANNINTPDGGTHLTGFRSALTKVINDYAKKNSLIKDNDSLTGDDIREGLTAIVSVKLSEPQFEGQTKNKLGSPHVRNIVERIMTEWFGYYLEEHPAEAKKIIAKAQLSARARLAAKAARETVIRKGALEGTTLPGKLQDCSSKDPSQCEIYLVEGDSAGGSVVQARDSKFQAVLPLRGKVLNVERARLDRMLSSDAIKHIIIAMGVGIGENFDLSKLRYNRIILMTDADVDGSHIRTLLLTLFFRHMPEVIEKGHLYIAQPPLYKIEVGKKVKYAYTEDQKETVLSMLAAEKAEKANLKNTDSEDLSDTTQNISDVTTAAELAELAISESVEDSNNEELEYDESRNAAVSLSEKYGLPGLKMQRYKGLGEMNYGQLWETTMDPEVRVLIQVTVEDAQKADQVFYKLMGDEVSHRKHFINSRAKYVKNLDV